MDPSMIAGIVSGLALLFYAIGFEDFGAFINPQGLAIVIGGTIAAIAASFPLEALKKAPKQIVIAIKGKASKPSIYIDQIEDCANIARKQGILALEPIALEQEDDFLRAGIFLIVDALDATKVRGMLESELAYLDERHAEAVTLYEKGAAYAPAFGLMGTVIGLVLMLGNLEFDDPAAAQTLTNGMAIALLTTFYGSLFANLFFLPVANKLQVLNDRELLCKQIVVEGILSVQAGENPKFIREKLISFLPIKERAAFNTEQEGG